MAYVSGLDVVPLLEEMLEEESYSPKELYDFISEHWCKVEDGDDLEKLFYYLYDCRFVSSYRCEIREQLKRQLKKQMDAKGYITIYRGFNEYSREDGNSFTLSKDVAIRFSNRWGEDKGYVNKYKIHINRVMAFITDRNEAEIIADPDDVILLGTL